VTTIDGVVSSGILLRGFFPPGKLLLALSSPQAEAFLLIIQYKALQKVAVL
jgi:hypothetical protein